MVRCDGTSGPPIADWNSSSGLPRFSRAPRGRDEVVHIRSHQRPARRAQQPHPIGQGTGSWISFCPQDEDCHLSVAVRTRLQTSLRTSQCSPFEVAKSPSSCSRSAYYTFPSQSQVHPPVQKTPRVASFFVDLVLAPDATAEIEMVDGATRDTTIHRRLHSRSW